MNRKAKIIYIILITTFFIAAGLSIYYYQKLQINNKQMDEAVTFEASLPAYHFALIGEERNHEYWRLVGEGAKELESEYDVFVEYEAPKRSNPDEQLKLVDMAIKSKVDGIIVQALNDNFTPMINKAVNEGIPVITVDTDSPDSERNAYIGTDNYEAGRLAGEALVNDTNGQATVGIITGNLDNLHHQLRLQGFKDVVEDVEGIEIVAIEESNITRVEAEETAYSMLMEYENITAFYGTSSYNGLGIVAAADSLKKQNDIYVITFDAIKQNIELLENGDIDAIVEQQPFEMGNQSIKVLLDILQDREIEEIYHTDTSVIRRNDLASMTERRMLADD
ncbi:ribose transport system substrate-binding protein [Gracilibacillus halotolerans]|uniref:Ribose transport system substrate-binding protein n=1 Tax=Gracilibacillus halotolerans TaxID=74386 RepID=A0A841RGN1_9BACI|nr:sugar-binding protein [Gracilibacillus halotolerans]MBB6513290.1 ribose transport system substrate-binding protein [Gracilibacillus halotolerans]